MSAIVFVLLSLSGFGVSPNPSPAPPAEVVRYAPDAADVMMYVDLKALIPNNWAQLDKLADQPLIKADPMVRAMIQERVMQAKGMHLMVKMAAGVDLATDVDSIAAFFILKKDARPAMVAAIRGRFPKDLVANLGKLSKTPITKASGRDMVVSDGIAGMLAADGTFIVGDVALVKQRAVNVWKPVAKTGAGVKATTALAESPFAVMTTALSARTLAWMRAELKNDNDEEKQLVKDLLFGVESGSMWLRHDGAGWTVTTRTAPGFERAADASDGMLALMRANHNLTRGFVRMFFAAAPSFAKQLGPVVKLRPELLRLVDAWTGDGMFPADVQRVPATRTVTVRAKGKTLSEVLPMSGMIPIGAVFYLTMSGGSSKSSQPMMKPPTRSTSPRPPKTRTR